MVLLVSSRNSLERTSVLQNTVERILFNPYYEVSKLILLVNLDTKLFFLDRVLLCKYSCGIFQAGLRFPNAVSQVFTTSPSLYGAGAQTQAIVQARRVLLHLRATPSPALFFKGI